MSRPIACSGRHREGARVQAHVDVSARDCQCPMEVIIVDGPDDSAVNKSAANGR